MDNPFFGRSWDRVPDRTFTVPVSGTPGIVDLIPVRYVNVEEVPRYGAAAASRTMDEVTAAVKIQSAFRGFSVRKSKRLKNLKIIAQVKASMEEMQRHISDSQLLELIRQNEKERMKIAEGIMSLLLKLDEIQGVKSFVRESRRAVAHELVSLHEKVEAICGQKFTEGKVTAVSMDNQARESEGRKGRCWLRTRMTKIVRRSYWSS